MLENCNTRAAGEVRGAVTLADTVLEVWAERDRLCIELHWADEHGESSGESVPFAHWWDDDARAMIEDGFFDPRDLHRSVFDYCAQMGFLGGAE